MQRSAGTFLLRLPEKDVIEEPYGQIMNELKEIEVLIDGAPKNWPALKLVGIYKKGMESVRKICNALMSKATIEFLPGKRAVRQSVIDDYPRNSSLSVSKQLKAKHFVIDEMMKEVDKLENDANNVRDISTLALKLVQVNAKIQGFRAFVDNLVASQLTGSVRVFQIIPDRDALKHYLIDQNQLAANELMNDGLMNDFWWGAAMISFENGLIHISFQRQFVDSGILFKAMSTPTPIKTGESLIAIKPTAEYFMRLPHGLVFMSSEDYQECYGDASQLVCSEPVLKYFEKDMEQNCEWNILQANSSEFCETYSFLSPFELVTIAPSEFYYFAMDVMVLFECDSKLWYKMLFGTGRIQIEGGCSMTVSEHKIVSMKELVGKYFSRTESNSDELSLPEMQQKEEELKKNLGALKEFSKQLGTEIEYRENREKAIEQEMKKVMQKLDALKSENSGVSGFGHFVNQIADNVISFITDKLRMLWSTFLSIFIGFCVFLVLIALCVVKMYF